MACTSALAVALQWVAAGDARSASGDLDVTFDVDGKVVRNFGGVDFANAIAQTADGKLVVAGASGGNFALARFNPNGTLDTTFGKGGVVFTDFGGSADSAGSMVIASNGKIIAVGRTGSTTTMDFAVARYNANGALDTTFSGDGKLKGTFGQNDAIALDVALAADGSIWVVGDTRNGNFGIAKLTAAGAFDNSFSGDGRLTRDFGGSDFATSVFPLADGSIIVFGAAAGDFGMAKFSADGTELVLNGGGVENGAPRTDFFNQGDFPRAAAVQADGKFVVVGQVLTGGIPSRTMGVARFNPDGTLDTTFSENGLRVIGFGEISDAQAVTIQIDGKIVVAGHTGDSDAQRLAIARLLPNGSLDNTFSGDGRLQTPFGPNAGANGVVAQRADGRIVVAGSAETTNPGSTTIGVNSILARYHAIQCNNRDVTAIGTNGPDTLSGTVFVTSAGIFPAVDVIHGFGGNDTINAGGANDHICGGAGNDTLSGGEGADVVIGDGGSDSHNGGNGTDTCIGDGLASTFDTFTSCETVNDGRSGLSGEWRSLVQHCNRSRPRPKCELRGSIEVFNPGEESTAVAAVVAFYLSADETLDDDDAFLGSRRVGALAAGETTELSLRLRLRGRRDLSGLFVIAVLDATNVIIERNEENNVVPEQIP